MSQDTLFFAFYYYPSNTSGVQRASRLAKYLPEHGHRVHVVTTSASGTRADLTNVAYVPGPGPIGPRLAWRIRGARLAQRILPFNEQIPWAPHALEAGARLIERHGITGMISTSPPLAGHYAAYFLKKRYPKLRWIADFRDPLLGRPGRTRQWAVPYDRAVQKAFLHTADAAVTVSEPIANSWLELHPELRSKVHVIYNGFDPAEGFGPKPLERTDRKVLAHVGVIYPQRHPVAIAESLDRLTAAGRLDPNGVQLRLTGALENAAEFLGRPAVRALQERGCLLVEPENIPRADAMAITASSHALLLLDVTKSGAGYTVPAKIFDYVLTGRTVLAVTASGSPAERILAGSGIRHFFVTAETQPESVDDRLMAVFGAPSDPSPPSEWFLESFDGRRQAGAFARLLRQDG